MSKRKKDTKKQQQQKATEDKLTATYKLLITLCGKAHKISLSHLAIAITKRYRYFITSDEALHKKSTVLNRRFHILIVGSIYDIKDYEHGGPKPPFGFYA